MKYCPLCGAEYRAGHDVCANCAVPLVDSLEADEVRSNPAHLFWIGKDVHEFELVAAALREAGIPANAAEGLGGIVGALLKSESKIYVLQADLERALEAATKAIAIRQRGFGLVQTCHACGSGCSASLTVCPKCKAILFIEPKKDAMEGAALESPAPSPMKYCPLCDAEYTASHTRCTVCGVELVPEELRGRPLDQRQQNEGIVMVWRGGDPLAVSEVVNRLREAGIRHHVHATNDHLVFELGMPRPKIRRPRLRVQRIQNDRTPRGHSGESSVWAQLHAWPRGRTNGIARTDHPTMEPCFRYGGNLEWRRCFAGRTARGVPARESHRRSPRWARTRHPPLVRDGSRRSCRA
jgi:hypothetical protein